MGALSGGDTPSARRSRAPGSPRRAAARACPGGAGWCREPPRRAGPAVGGQRWHLVWGQPAGTCSMHPPGSAEFPPHSSLSSTPGPAPPCIQPCPPTPALPGEHLQELSHVPKPLQHCHPLQRHQGTPQRGHTRTSSLENRWDRSIWGEKRSRGVSHQECGLRRKLWPDRAGQPGRGGFTHST